MVGIPISHVGTGRTHAFCCAFSGSLVGTAVGFGSVSCVCTGAQDADMEDSMGLQNASMDGVLS